jgi:hypothetical protein
MLKHYPQMNYYLASNGDIVHSPAFESAIVKVIDEDWDSLDDIERNLLGPFRQTTDASARFGVSPVKDVSYALQALKKKRKVTMNEFIDVSFNALLLYCLQYCGKTF